ncbi:MAG: CehA/McbA family metallohydrolase [Planctomycetota bacterium]
MTISLESPCHDGSGTMWLRGNLHTHTTRSDGGLDPQATIRRYAGQGYDFLALSDHDTLADYTRLDPCGMILIPANEISHPGGHLLDINAKIGIPPDTNHQACIDRINRESGFAILCHPNWLERFNHYTFEQLLDLNGYAGIEIFNGVCLYHPGSPRAVEKWDRLIAAGRTVWGYANDDCHQPDRMALGWNVVRVRERTAAAVVEALRTGNFHASTGVIIESLRCEGAVLCARASNAEAMAVFGNNGRRLAFVPGNELRFDASDITDDPIRIEGYGWANTMAWTQPIAVRGGPGDKVRRLAMEESPAIRALRADRPVRISGRLDDPLWEKAEASKRFVNYAIGTDAGILTEFRVILAPDAVVVGVRCQETLLHALRTAVTGDNDPKLWLDDSIELFFDIAGDGKQVLRVVTNAAGKTSAGWSAPGGAPVRPTAAAGRIPGGWAVEVAVPLAGLAGVPPAGAHWGFHVCRNRHAGPGTFIWAWIGTSNHNAARYGRLEF